MNWKTKEAETLLGKTEGGRVSLMNWPWLPETLFPKLMETGEDIILAVNWD